MDGGGADEHPICPHAVAFVRQLSERDEQGFHKHGGGIEWHGTHPEIVTCKTIDELKLPPHVDEYVREKAAICQPKDYYICIGTEVEQNATIEFMLKLGMIKQLPKHENTWLVRTNPADVARVESKTIIVTPEKRTSLADTKPGVESKLGHWMSPADFEVACQKRWPGCMKGRTMFIIPFSMGPVKSPLSKTGIEITDCPYVVACMHIMTKMGPEVLEALYQPSAKFIKCLHSVGQPLPTDRPVLSNWPCNPELTLIAHIPDNNEIISYGSGYGGNSLLGKKCFALRLGSVMAKREGWMAEHMLIMGIKPPNGKKRYIAAAFPSQCGKTNLAMLMPTLPGYEVTCVGDDIAWMKFDEEGVLRAINPESGIFGVAPGTSMATNPAAMKGVMANTIFTNVAETADGGFYWEGLEDQLPDGMGVIDWTNREWTKGCGRPAAHPNSRFTAPIGNLDNVDEHAFDPKGVPIDAILFGGRRPKGYPLVMESFDWEQGVFYGAAMRSQITAAAEFKGTALMHDPFAMRPFFGYNFGHYVQHWLDQPKLYPNAKLPKIYHVNWFRKGPQNEFLWPGFGDNCRVLDWILRRCDGSVDAIPTPVGSIPKQEDFNLSGLKDPINWNELFSVPADLWKEEIDDIKNYFEEQVASDLPPQMWKQLEALKSRLG
jgi:phosphoenolpyruvate carboxykinase (GTP)